MTTPPMNPAGWYPDPHQPGQVRWWDGQQWTSATHPVAQQATPEQTTGQASGTTQQGKRKRTPVVLGAIAIGILAIGVIGNATSEDDDESVVASTSSVSSSASTVRTTPAAATTRTTTRTSATTTALLPAAAPAPASSATEAGCDEPDSDIVAAIENSLTPGLDLINVAAVSTMVDGIEYTYTAGDVFENGERHTSSVVWVTPGFGVMGLSSNSRNVSDLPFGRGVLEANAGDEYGAKVQNCVMALSRSR